MAADAPVDLAPHEVVLRFLQSVGRRADAEFYLGLFRATAQERFACVCIDAPVLSSALDAVALDLRFLSALGLVPVVVVGLFEIDAAVGHTNALQRSLERVGVASKICAVGAVGDIVASVHTGGVPIVALPPKDSVASRFACLAALVIALRSRKLIFLQRRGGLCRDGCTLPWVNLTTGYADLIASTDLSPKQRFVVEQARALLCEGCTQPLTVAIVSPLDLLRELFTVKGAGTLLRRGAVIHRHLGWGGIDLARLRLLLDSAFGKSLRDEFLSVPPACVYLEENYRGAAVLVDTPLGAYLSKFAVEREAQGEGIGSDLWDSMMAVHAKVFWRSRRSNPIDSWYVRQCDGLLRSTPWTLFWTGFAATDIAAAAAHAWGLPDDF